MYTCQQVLRSQVQVQVQVLQTCTRVQFEYKYKYQVHISVTKEPDQDRQTLVFNTHCLCRVISLYDCKYSLNPLSQT